MARILLDMDGPLVDFFSGALNACDPLRSKDIWPKGVWGMPPVLGMTDAEFWEEINQDPDFWIDLKPQPWLASLITLVSKYDPEFIVASVPCFNSNCVSQKLEWLRTHISSDFNRYMFGQSKCLLAGEDMVLIDDKDETVIDFSDYGGKGILFPMRTNSLYEKADNPIDYVATCLEEICSF